jgi:hypothetical protein
MHRDLVRAAGSKATEARPPCAREGRRPLARWKDARTVASSGYRVLVVKSLIEFVADHVENTTPLPALTATMC